MSEVITEREDGTRRVSIVFDPDRVEIRRKRNGLEYEYFPERSRTKPEFHREVNINRIMKKYHKTRQIDPLILRDMKFGDFANGNDFATMMMRVKDAHYEFDHLPSQVRNRFNNEPAQLLNFLADPANDGEAIELGLKVKPPTPPPAPVGGSAPAAAPATPAAPVTP